MGHYLVAMTNGENVGFGLGQRGFSLTVDKVWSGKTVDYPTFIDALQHYLREHDLQTRDMDSFALAVSGIPSGDVLSIANCRWYLSVSGIRSFLRTEPLILNEFVASAWALTALDRSKFLTIGTHAPRPIVPGSTFLIVGVGFNLGVATLHITRDGQIVALESQGGHGSFAPQTAADDAILPYLRRRFGHVSYEHILSDSGLETVYQALADSEGKSVTAPPTAQIITAGRQRSDPIAVNALRVFTSTLGSFIGSQALSAGAWDGVFVTGATVHDVTTSLTQADFRNHMTSKGTAAKLLDKVPVAYLNHDYVRLLGCSAALAARETFNQPELDRPRLAAGG